MERREPAERREQIGRRLRKLRTVPQRRGNRLEKRTTPGFGRAVEAKSPDTGAREGIRRRERQKERRVRSRFLRQIWEPSHITKSSDRERGEDAEKG